MLDLRAFDGVEEVVVLDREGDVVVRTNGEAPEGEDRFLVVVHRASRIIAGRDVADESAHLHLQDGGHSVWVAAVGAGARLVVFWRSDATPGLFWRRGVPCARDLRRLVAAALGAGAGGCDG